MVEAADRQKYRDVCLLADTLRKFHKMENSSQDPDGLDQLSTEDLLKEISKMGVT